VTTAKSPTVDPSDKFLTYAEGLARDGYLNPDGTYRGHPKEGTP
jgi:hypothetical protein